MKEMDYSHLDGRHLRFFLAVYEAGSVTGAAARLAITQSAVSHALERLRAILGDPLFVRSGRGIVPTERAEALVEPARRLLADMRAMAEVVEFTPVRASGTFVIATNDNERELLLPPVFHHINREAPGVDLQIVPNRLDLQHTLRSGEVDLGLSPVMPEGTEFIRESLYTDTFAVFYDSGARTAPRDLKTYLAARHAQVVFAPYLVPPVDAALAQQGRSRRVVVKVPHISALPAMLRGTDVLATLPRNISGTILKGFAVCPCPVELPVLEFQQVWHLRNHNAGLNRWVRGLIGRQTRHLKQAGSGP